MSLSHGIGLALLLAAGPAASDELLVFAAASTAEAMQDLARRFEAERPGTHLLLSFGASSDLSRQVAAGAPAHLFLCADAERAQPLEKKGLVKERVDLLSNTLVVMVSDRARAQLRRAQDLERVERLALGDPAAVPAGVYARRWLEAKGLWRAVEGKVIPTLDVRAALSAVESGRSEAAIVYRTDAAVAKRARVAFEVPAAEGPTIVYPLLRLSDSSAARAFFELAIGQKGREAFESRGFTFLKGSPSRRTSP